MNLIAEPLRADSFAPYGDVLDAPKEAGRVYFNGSLGSGRAGAAPSLSVVNVQKLITLPHTATRMERHEFSSQSFLPLDVERWLVIVAPKTDHGGPDTTKARAYLSVHGQGITYRPDTWHHPLAVLDRPARFAVFMWLEGSSTDEEFVTLDRPFTVTVPA